jgi:ubiquinone/menaquinone biosynthesis C-methylase UbiE
MTEPSPLASPGPWDLVSAAYAEEVVPVFTRYAEDALSRARVGRGQVVLDVAAGPGTLTLLAARRGARVHAIDFSRGMVETLRARALGEGITGVEAQIGDGQALPFEDATFDAAFSMFGLMFFPDRVRGFREMRRILRTNAPAVVSSWQPLEEQPVLAEVFRAIRDHLPGIPFGTNKAPLGLASEYLDEMGQAGFRGIEVHEVTHAFDAPSAEHFWELSVRSNAAIVVLKEKLGEKWAGLDVAMRERLCARCGNGPLQIAMAANLAIGHA